MIDMLDEKSSTPLYSQLYSEMMNNIATGKWSENYKLPTEEELCRQYNVSRITVRMALDKLKMQGYLYRKQGKGSFVTRPVIEQTLTNFYSFSTLAGQDGNNTSSTVLAFEVIPCSRALAMQLCVGVDEPIYKIERIRKVGSKPFAYEFSYIPCKLCPGLSADSITQIGLYKSMQQVAGFSPNHARENFHAEVMDKVAAHHLGSKAGQAAFSIQRTAYHDDLVVEYCDTLARGDMITYQVDLNSL